jgi:hypothetical protein
MMHFFLSQNVCFEIRFLHNFATYFYVLLISFIKKFCFFSLCVDGLVIFPRVCHILSVLTASKY